MKVEIELIYSADCPNVDLARNRLASAFSVLGMHPEWVEWERQDPAAPEYAVRYGSPTVLINGRDVAAGLAAPGPAAASRAGEADSCRVYPASAGFDRAPSIEQLVEAMRWQRGR